MDKFHRPSQERIRRLHRPKSPPFLPTIHLQDYVGYCAASRTQRFLCDIVSSSRRFPRRLVQSPEPNPRRIARA